MITQLGEIQYDVEGIGIGEYKVRATTDKGKKKAVKVYADNISDKLRAPSIKKDKEPNGAGWYNIATSPVTITLTGEGTIKYRVITGGTINESGVAEGGTDYTGPFTINNVGLNTIYAWTTDGIYRSEYATEKIRIDTNKPNINDPEVSQVNKKAGINAGGKTWYTSDVEIAVSGNDQTSEPIHYEYRLPGKNETWQSKEINEKISVKDEGETRVAIRTIDTAGNTSDEKSVLIGIDRIAPTFTTSSVNIDQENIKASSVTFTVNATDEGSGKTGGITYIAEIAEIGGTTKEIKSNNGTFEVTGLSKQATYTINVKAKDPAGNESTAISGEFKTKGELNTPNITIEPKTSGIEGTNGWTKGPVTIIISDSAGSNETSAEYIYYEITNTKTGASAKTGGPIAVPSTSFDFSTDGEYQIIAWVQDGDGTSANRSENITENFKIDAGTPLPASITVSATNAGPATNANAKQYYYNTRASVTIKAGTDVTSGVYGVRYEVTGAQTKGANNYPYTSSGEGIDITTEGDSTIRAWTVDKAGNLSQTATEITIHLDNTAPSAPSLNITTAHSIYSTDDDPWFKDATVNVSLTGGTDQGSYKTGEYQLKYGTRTAGTSTTPTLTQATGNTANVAVTAEGRTEILAYTVDKAGKVSSASSKIVQIDRTKPTVASLSCTPEELTKISMAVSGASDGSGSGLAKYLFFLDNNSNSATQVNADSMGKKTYSYTTTTGYHTGHVSAVDKAGNISDTASYAEGRTKMYAYSQWKWGRVYSKVNLGKISNDWGEYMWFTGCSRAWVPLGPDEYPSSGIFEWNQTRSYKNNCDGPQTFGVPALNSDTELNTWLFCGDPAYQGGEYAHYYTGYDFRICNGMTGNCQLAYRWNYVESFCFKFSQSSTVNTKFVENVMLNENRRNGSNRFTKWIFLKFY